MRRTRLVIGLLLLCSLLACQATPGVRTTGAPSAIPIATTQPVPTSYPPSVPESGNGLAYPFPASPATPTAVILASQIIPAEIRRLPVIGYGIRSFSFADPQHGWLATGLGWEDYYDYGLLSTSDGGQTWQVVSTENGLSGQLQFISATLGYRLGSPGTVHVLRELQKSEDGGLSWKTIYDPKALREHLKQFQFLDEQNGFLMVEKNESPKGLPEHRTDSLKATSDGGRSWKLLPRPATIGERDNLGVFDFINPQEGWLTVVDFQTGAFTKLLKTGDGGATWVTILQVDNPDDLQSDLPRIVLDLDFLDDRFGCFLGGYGFVYTTEDSGLTWVRRSAVPSLTIDIQLLDKLHEFALVGSDFPTRSQALMASADGSQTWELLYPPLAPWFWDLYDQNLAFGVGTAYDPSAFLSSQDGGRTWRKVSSLGSNVIGPGAIHFITPQEGWIVAQISLEHDAPIVLYHTLDSGQTWQLLKESHQNTRRVQWALNSSVGFVDKSLGFAAIDGELWRTEDGGLSFTPVTTQERVPNYLQFASERIGWGLREDQIFATEDGGQTWQPLGLGYPVRVAIPPGGRPFSLLPGGLAWVQIPDCPPGVTYSQCQSVLLSSRDFGENWIAYDLGETYFEELHFIDRLHGWARGGESGHGAMKGGYVWGSEYIYRTEDGGKSWQMIR